MKKDAMRQGMQTETTEYRALCDLVEDRAISQSHDLAALADALRGMDAAAYRPRVVCRADGTVLVGHGIVGAMRLLGWPRALCTVLR